MNVSASIDFEPLAYRPEAEEELSPNIGDLLAMALDSLTQGIGLVEAGGVLVYANASARTNLARAGWRGCGGVLSPRNPRQQSAWASALGQTCLCGRRQLLELDLADGVAFVALVPIVVDDVRLALVTFGRPELCGVLELQLFGSHYGLTYQENLVLRQLSLGLRPAQIADLHGVARSTVLTQVAAVRAKTLCASISELLAKLACMPALRAAVNDCRPVAR